MEWKQLRDYNYEISINGDIRNKTTGRIIKQRMQKEGYLLIDLKIPSIEFGKNVNKTFRTHRIIAEVFLGANPYGWEVDHINKVRNDNRVENLRWMNKSENSSNRTYSFILMDDIKRIIDLYNQGDDFQKIYLKVNNKIK